MTDRLSNTLYTFVMKCIILVFHPTTNYGVYCIYSRHISYNQPQFFPGTIILRKFAITIATGFINWFYYSLTELNSINYSIFTTHWTLEKEWNYLCRAPVAIVVVVVVMFVSSCRSFVNGLSFVANDRPDTHVCACPCFSGLGARWTEHDISKCRCFALPSSFFSGVDFDKMLPDLLFNMYKAS